MAALSNYPFGTTAAQIDALCPTEIECECGEIVSDTDLCECAVCGVQKCRACMEEADNDTGYLCRKHGEAADA